MHMLSYTALLPMPDVAVSGLSSVSQFPGGKMEERAKTYKKGDSAGMNQEAGLVELHWFMVSMWP
jgi:hypothetical protein